jgi:HAD superfamily hydrolase (TIGR01509 family)
MPPAVSAVIFDMDGVLLDTERVGMAAWIDAAREQGCELTPEVYGGLIGLDAVGVRQHLRLHEWPDEAAERLGRLAWKKYLTALKRDGVPCKPGVFELLDFLEARSIPRGVATSTETSVAEQKLEHVGVLSRFDAIVGGDQVTSGKPSPDIYLRAAGRLNHAARSCLALEDSGPGIRAASAAGMRVIWVPDLCNVDRATQALAYAVAPSLSAAIGVIEPLLARPDSR